MAFFKALFQQSVLNKYLSGIHEQLVNETKWMEYFNQPKAQADDLKSQIAQTDPEIDGMVYELYGLSDAGGMVDRSGSLAKTLDTETVS